MNRRTAFKKILQNNKDIDSSTLTASSGLAEYQGVWEFKQAAHLLRRASFSPTKAMFQEAISLGMEATVDKLFSANLNPDPPIYYEDIGDPLVAEGETWVDAPYDPQINVKPARARSMKAWVVKQMMEEGISVREKLNLFWINHYAIGGLNDLNEFYKYVSLLKSNVWGDFKQLTKDISTNLFMLRFLNGNTNRVGSPNENFARELLELYTIGKGPLAGPGDYTNYTEQDVEEMARVLTGWQLRGFNNNNPDVTPGTYFTPSRHDTGVKQLSPRFDNQTISDMGENEYKYLINVIFEKDEVARHICRKLYRWFVYYKIDETVEADVIEPMAQLLISENYQIHAVLRVLFKSEHFYDILSVGPMIKSHFEFIIGIVKTIELPPSEPWQQQLAVYQHLYIRAFRMGMDYQSLPQVAGWKAYYLRPLYNRNWINATSLQARSTFSTQMANIGFYTGNGRYKFDHIAFIATLEDPLDPNSLIAEIVKLLMPVPLLDSQLIALKDILIPGLPDFEWTVDYGDYLADPTNANLRKAVDSRLINLFTGLFSMAEYHLS